MGQLHHNFKTCCDGQEKVQTKQPYSHLIKKIKIFFKEYRRIYHSKERFTRERESWCIARSSPETIIRKRRANKSMRCKGQSSVLFLMVTRWRQWQQPQLPMVKSTLMETSQMNHTSRLHYASAMVTSTSTPGSMLMDVICLTISEELCRSMRRLWMRIWKRSHVLDPSPHGVLRVVMRSTCTGRRRITK